MLTKILFTIILLTGSVMALSIQNSDLFKEKEELLEIKDELNEFYEIKELAYQKNKKELERIQKNIKIDELSIIETKKENQKILDEINRVITSKVMAMYDKMKLGVVINVFNEMLEDGEIDEVFDIMIRMPEKKVMKVMKKLDVKTSTILMKKMRINKENPKKEGK